MNTNRFGQGLKKKAIAACVATVVTLGASTPAQAYEWDPVFRGWERTVYTSFVTQVNNQFYAINTALAEIYAYLASGEGDTGTGVIGAINANMNKIWSEQRPYMDAMTNQQGAMGRRNMIDGVNSAVVMGKQADPRTCAEKPATMGARGAAGAGSSGMRLAKGLAEDKLTKQEGGSKSSDAQYAGDIVATHKDNGYCSITDAKYLDKDGNPLSDRLALGCKESDTHKMPDADSRIQSVFRPAHDYAAADSVKKYGNSLTYNNGATTSGKQTPLPGVGDQAKAADDAISMMVARFSPPTLPQKVEQTPAGKILLAKVKVFNSRISPAVDFLTTAKARLDASQNQLPNASAVLSDLQDFFKRTYPDSIVPVNASDAEITRYEVLRRYADPEGTWALALDAASGDAAKLATIQAQSQAVELYLLYNMHERQTETNALLSAILAQTVNPITREEISAASAAVSR